MALSQASRHRLYDRTVTLRPWRVVRSRSWTRRCGTASRRPTWRTRRQREVPARTAAAARRQGRPHRGGQRARLRGRGRGRAADHGAGRARRARCSGSRSSATWTGERSVDWIASNGGGAINLLTKGSREHCEKQLRLDAGAALQGHRRDRSLRQASASGRERLSWRTGRAACATASTTCSRTYRTWPRSASKACTCPTRSATSRRERRERYVDLMTRTWPEPAFEFHGHNDYGVAGELLAAIEPGRRACTPASTEWASGRATPSRRGVARSRPDGDARHVSEKPAGRDQRDGGDVLGQADRENSPVSGETSSRRPPGSTPTATPRRDLYATSWRRGASGSGGATRWESSRARRQSTRTCKALGIKLGTRNRDLLLKRVVELGDRKHTVTAEDLPLIIADVLKTPEEEIVRIEEYEILSRSSGEPSANLTLRFRGKSATASASGHGGYDAFMKALAKAARRFDLKLPALVDYKVRIPPGGKTGALVETVVTWRKSTRGALFTTRAVDPDQTAAAVLATEKMLNLLVSQ